MENKTIRNFILFIFTLFPAFSLMSQSIEEGEQDWAVWTDRTFYISGEKIQFTAISKQTVKSSDNESDKVLYCELLSAEGAQMVGGKFPVKQGRVTGSLTIPEKTFSGYYLLSFYTKRMRIGTSAVFPGIRLKILHPEIVDVLTVEANIPHTDSLSKLMLPQEQSQYVSVTTEHDVYQPDDSIRIKLSFTGKVKPDILNLSIVPEFSYQPQHNVIQKLYFTDSVRNLLPDTRGVSISGVIIDKLTKQPIQGIRVSVTIIGEKDVMARKTDKSGFFCFALPDRYGLKDLFLCTEKREGKQPEIFIDNDFSPGKRRLPVGELRLDSAESVLALNLIRNYKISTQYYPDTAMNPVTNSFAGIPFYGSKSEKLIMESYIDLPTVEDYFREIPVMMNVRKSEGKKVFRFINTKPEMSIYEPMVLIDWVMVDDIESLLAISPSVIDRVELVNDIYIKGDLIYGGIISFISKKNDFAGIKLPPNGKFINYQFFTELGKKELDLSRNMHLPDSRNTLLWIPQISYNEGIETILRTKAPASSGKYLILVRGIGADMKEFEISSNLEIIAQ